MEVKELSIREKIGQMFMIGIDNSNGFKNTAELIHNNRIGGVILYRKNYKNYDELVKLVNDIKDANFQNHVPIFISIDQEGGRVNRMPPEIENLKSATKFANSKDKEKVALSAKIIAEMLKKTGITLNYAPVLDIRRFEEKHAIGDRCYGQTKEEVEEYGITAMKAMMEEGVVPVVKHFPGHGLTKKDSHFRIPRIKQKIDILEKEDMEPFQKSIENGTDAIMVGHLIIEDVDKKYPASLSKKVIQKYLIEKYNYTGLIMTDDLKMMAIRFHYNMKKAVVKAIEAGNDIIMLGLPYWQTKRIMKYVIGKVKRGKISEERINESVEKILKIKEKYQLNDEEVEGFNKDEFNKKIINLNNSL